MWKIGTRNCRVCVCVVRTFLSFFHFAFFLSFLLYLNCDLRGVAWRERMCESSLLREKCSSLIAPQVDDCSTHTTLISDKWMAHGAHSNRVLSLDNTDTHTHTPNDSSPFFFFSFYLFLSWIFTRFGVWLQLESSSSLLFNRVIFNNYSNYLSRKRNRQNESEGERERAKQWTTNYGSAKHKHNVEHCLFKLKRVAQPTRDRETEEEKKQRATCEKVKTGKRKDLHSSEML